MTSERTIRRRATAALGAAAVVLALAGCGVKSSPDYPPGATYPRQYPAPASATTPKAEPKKEETPASPTRFPYDYPNRPPARY